MVKDIHSIKTNTKEIKDSLQSQYVTRNEFNPVKSIVYGMVGVILLAVLGALVALVVGQNVKQPTAMSNGVLR
jgi:Na+/H+ antiporter NhaC